MNTYNTRIFHELIPNELHGSHPKKELTFSYKGFPIERLPPYHLYEITPREGCDLPAMLAGKYTKLETLEAQINLYLSEPSASAETAYVERPKNPQRGRPKKVRSATHSEVKATAEVLV